ncbi:MAG: MFS transporter [Anaerolineales bacterium]
MSLHFPPSLRHRPFALLWGGLLISVAGSQMQLWALFWHIREITPEPMALGAVGAARILPVLVFALIGGAIADSASRRKVMFFTQFLMMLVALALYALTLSGQIQLWHIYLLTTMQGAAVAFDTPARQSLTPNLVPAIDLPNAFSLQSIAFQVGSIIGPALSGLVIAQWGLAYTYLINAVTYLAVLGALLLMGHIPQQKQTTGSKPLSLRGIREGIGFIRTHPIILATMVLDFVATFFASANTLMPIIARDVLKVGEVEYGWLSSAQAVGAMSAGLALSQMRVIRRQGRVFMGSVFIFGLATIFFGLARHLWVAFAMLVVIGAADSVSTILRNTIRQLQTPDNLRGRMVSINQIFFMGGPQLGEIEAGAVAQAFGAPFAVVSGGVACILGVWWIARRWKALPAYNGDEATAAGGPASP